MSYHYTDTIQPTASMGSVGVKIQEQPRPETFIDLAVERICRISESTGAMRVKLTENANRVLGVAPEECANDGPAQSIQLPDTLFDQLAYALERLEEEHRRLVGEIDRNCWAV